MQKGMLQGNANKCVLKCFWHEGIGTFTML